MRGVPGTLGPRPFSRGNPGRMQSRGRQTGVGDFANCPYAVEAWGDKNGVVRTANGWRPLSRFRVLQQVELVEKPYRVTEHRHEVRPRTSPRGSADTATPISPSWTGRASSRPTTDRSGKYASWPSTARSRKAPGARRVVGGANGSGRCWPPPPNRATRPWSSSTARSSPTSPTNPSPPSCLYLRDRVPPARWATSLGYTHLTLWRTGGNGWSSARARPVWNIAGEAPRERQHRLAGFCRAGPPERPQKVLAGVPRRLQEAVSSEVVAKRLWASIPWFGPARFLPTCCQPWESCNMGGSGRWPCAGASRLTRRAGCRILVHVGLATEECCLVSAWFLPSLTSRFVESSERDASWRPTGRFRRCGGQDLGRRSR